MEKQVKTHHPWRVRFSIGIVMLLIAFLGLVVMSIHRTIGWHYWQGTVFVFAALSFVLSVCIRKNPNVMKPATLWHEVLLWTGALASVGMVSVIENVGVIGRFEGSLVILLLIAFATYIAGVYIDWMLILIGITLGAFAMLAALTAGYIYIISLSALFVLFIVFFFCIHHYHRRKYLQQKENEREDNAADQQGGNAMSHDITDLQSRDRK